MPWGFDPDQRLWILGPFIEPPVKGQFTSSEDRKEVPKIAWISVYNPAEAVWGTIPTQGLPSKQSHGFFSVPQPYSYHSWVLFFSWNAFINGFPLDFPWISPLHRTELRNAMTSWKSTRQQPAQRVAMDTKWWQSLHQNYGWGCLSYIQYMFIYIYMHIYTLYVYSCKHVYTQIWYTKPKYSKP